MVCCKDICDALNISNARDAIAKLDDDEKMTVGLTDTLRNNTVGLTDSIGNQVQSINLVSESGMYTLILRCRDAVKKDLFHTVLENGLQRKYYLLFVKQENINFNRNKNYR